MTQAITYTTITTQYSDDFCTLSLNRPKKKNAMNRCMVEELTDFFTRLQVMKTRAIFLRGEGDVFCAGADIEEMSSLSNPASDSVNQKKTLWSMNRAIGSLMQAVQNCGAVSICGVNGVALGGGFGLMCACDYVIAVSNARMGMPETKLGLSPAQIAPFVVQRLGLHKSKQLALFGQTVTGSEALTLGLVDQTVDNAQMLEKCWHQLSAQIKACAPLANASTKAILHKSINGPNDALLDQAANEFVKALTSQEGQAGTLAFKEKKKPYWA